MHISPSYGRRRHGLYSMVTVLSISSSATGRAARKWECKTSCGKGFS